MHDNACSFPLRVIPSTARHHSTLQFRQVTLYFFFFSRFLSFSPSFPFPPSLFKGRTFRFCRKGQVQPDRNQQTYARAWCCSAGYLVFRLVHRLECAPGTSRERMSAEAEGYRIERSLVDCVAPPFKGGDSIYPCPRAYSWLLRGIFDRLPRTPRSPPCRLSARGAGTCTACLPAPLRRNPRVHFAPLLMCCRARACGCRLHLFAGLNDAVFEACSMLSVDDFCDIKLEILG